MNLDICTQCKFHLKILYFKQKLQTDFIEMWSDKNDEVNLLGNN